MTSVGDTLGRCKWFNGRKGFGFITTVGTDEPTDVFVHHSNVEVAAEQYKYLVEGEYVSFNVTETSEGEHKHQASNVTGVLGGKLMCETRTDNRDNQWTVAGNDRRDDRRGDRRDDRRGRGRRGDRD
tara:strand:- start:3729 stop:4109 length:381 start_codon:yes stop_codon:yes gene_type:complete